MRSTATRAALSVLVIVVSVTAGAGGRALAAPGPDGGEIRGSSRQAVPDSYIVVLRKTLRATRATDTPGALARRYGGTVRRTYTSALHGFEAKMSESAARQLAKDPAVSYVERNQWMSYGVAKQVQLVGVRVLGCDGRGSTATLIEGVNWVTAPRPPTWSPTPARAHPTGCSTPAGRPGTSPWRWAPPRPRC